MDAIIAQNQRETGQNLPGPSQRQRPLTVREKAIDAVDEYLSLPVSTAEEGTYAFWREYKKTTDKAQKSLCKLARIHLTPPPTSTGKHFDVKPRGAHWGKNVYTIFGHQWPKIE